MQRLGGGSCLYFSFKKFEQMLVVVVAIGAARGKRRIRYLFQSLRWLLAEFHIPKLGGSSRADTE